MYCNDFTSIKGHFHIHFILRSCFQFSTLKLGKKSFHDGLQSLSEQQELEIKLPTLQLMGVLLCLFILKAGETKHLPGWDENRKLCWSRTVGMQLTIILSFLLVIHLIIFSIIKWWKMLIKAQYDVLKCYFCQRPKDIQFTVIQEERNQNIFMIKKLKSENFARLLYCVLSVR